MMQHVFCLHAKKVAVHLELSSLKILLIQNFLASSFLNKFARAENNMRPIESFIIHSIW